MQEQDYQVFIGRAIYPNGGEFYVSLDLETGGLVETESIGFLARLLNDSVNDSKKVLLTKSPIRRREKPSQKQRVLEVMLETCKKVQEASGRIRLTKDETDEKKPESYEPLEKERLDELRKLWTRKYKKDAPENPFSYQPKVRNLE